MASATVATLRAGPGHMWPAVAGEVEHGAPTPETGQLGWSKSHDNNRNKHRIKRKRKDSVIYRHGVPRSPGRFSSAPTARGPTRASGSALTELHPGTRHASVRNDALFSVSENPHQPISHPRRRDGCATATGL